MYIAYTMSRDNALEIEVIMFRKLVAFALIAATVATLPTTATAQRPSVDTPDGTSTIGEIVQLAYRDRRGRDHSSYGCPDGVTCSGNGESDLPNPEALRQRAIAAGMEEIARIQASEPALSDDEQLQCLKYVRAGFDSPALYETRQGPAGTPPTLELREAAYIAYAKAKLSRNYRDCTARIHQANQAEAKRAEAAEARQKLTKLALAHRDPADVVAQVLNYTTFGADDGIGDSAFWWRDPSKGTCLYRLHYVLSVDWGALSFLMSGLYPPREIDLDQLDPKNISFETEPTWDGQRYAGLTTVVKHEGREIMAHRMQTLLLGDGRRDLDRLARGWALIYDGKCKGSKKLF